jgi:hypothetical protein
MIASGTPRIACSQPQQQPAAAGPVEHDLLQRVDAANQARYDNVLSFTDTEHYAVFRGDDETHPAAEMTVHLTYRKGNGKSYEIVSQSGSQVIQKFGLEPLLENEKEINDPAKVQMSWFTSANYDMHVKSGETRQMADTPCVAVAITPKRTAPNMLDGTLWVDPRDGSIAEVDGIASRSPSIFAGTTRMMRDYTKMSGFAMATHARAESHNALFGRTVIVIDYSDYKLETSDQKTNDKQPPQKP